MSEERRVLQGGPYRAVFVVVVDTAGWQSIRYRGKHEARKGLLDADPLTSQVALKCPSEVYQLRPMTGTAVEEIPARCS